MSRDKYITTILSPEDLRFEPQDYLLSSAGQTDQRALFRNLEPVFEENKPLLICLTGPSGSGKDSIILPLLESGEMREALAATSRGRRVNIANTPDEPEDKYIWLRKQGETESFEEYRQALVQEYSLVEHEVNNGFVYGLPLTSLQAAFQNPVTVLVNDNFAYRQIRDTVGNSANCLCVFVVPDSFDQLWQRVRTRENGEQRLRDAVRFIKDAPNVAHYYIHNASIEGGLEAAQSAMHSIIQLHTSYEP